MAKRTAPRPPTPQHAAHHAPAHHSEAHHATAHHITHATTSATGNAAHADTPLPVISAPASDAHRQTLGSRLRAFWVRGDIAARDRPIAASATKTPGKTVGGVLKRAKENALSHGVLGKRRPHHRLKRKSLEEYLRKAGYNINPVKFKRITFLVVVLVFLAVSLYFIGRFALLLDGASGVHLLRLIAFLAALWTFLFAAVLLVIQGAMYFYLDYRIWWRTREIEEALPDYLQLASANIAAGMPVERALWFAIRPNFGTLATEMQEVAKATIAGESLDGSLRHFAEKYDSPVLQRSVSILIEGMRAGGEMADLLNKIALNIDEIRIMKKEMAANVTTYAIFITFASVGVAPFLFALATELLTIIVHIMGSIDLSSSNSFFTIAATNPEVVWNFKAFSVAMLLVSTICSASIVSVIKRGNVFEGIKSIPVYAAIAIALYFFSLRFLGVMFGGLLTG